MKEMILEVVTFTVICAVTGVVVHELLLGAIL